MTQILTAGDALYAEILENPDDDTSRLIYADWLEEEGGQPERAEFIRVQVALTRGNFSCDQFMHSCGETLTLEQLAKLGCAKCKPYATLTLRERELWETATATGGWMIHPQFPPKVDDWLHHLIPQNSLSESKTVSMCVWRRGFPHTIRLPHDEFLQHGKAICPQHPIQRVELSDKRPDEAWWWWRDGEGHYANNPAYICSAIFNCFNRPAILAMSGVEFDSPEQANDAISDACLLFARKKD